MRDDDRQDLQVPHDVRTLVEVLRWRAQRHGDDTAFTHLLDGETRESNVDYAALDAAARRTGAMLREQGAAGQPVLLVFPPGGEFLQGFLGCLYGGAIAVPTYPPDPHRIHRTLSRFQAIAADCGATIALTTAPIRAMADQFLQMAPDLGRLRWLALDDAAEGAEAGWIEPTADPEAMSFLQYTSGSTGTPKGVMVSHRAMLANFAILTDVFANRPGETTLTWLPNYHDMGLIDGLLRPLYAGCRCVVMSPVQFLKRPMRWLEGITRYGAVTSGGPNFAYDLCARKVRPEQLEELDLRSWRTAYNGAEPVRPDTLRRFSRAFAPCGFDPEALWPCYGLAEATLFVTGGVGRHVPVTTRVRADALERHRAEPAVGDAPPADVVELVSSGRSHVEQLRIVDPDTRVACATGRVGEIWLAGDSLASGYWRREDATSETFGAWIAGCDDGPFLRTGDLGFLDDDGELFVTGRRKDLIIIRGRNLYPQDVERSVEESHPAAFRPGCGAAFAVDVDGEEQLVVLQELQRRFGKPDPKWVERRQPRADVEAFAPRLDAPPNRADALRSIRRAVVEGHDVQPHAVVLLKPGSILKTSSGKIQRRGCKAAYLKGELDVIAEWRADDTDDTGVAAAAPPSAPIAAERAPTPVVAAAENRTDQAAAQAVGGGRAPTPAEVRDWLRRRLADRVAGAATAVDVDRPFADHGLDSRAAIGLVGELEQWLGLEISPAVLYDHPTVRRLADHLGRQSDAGAGPEDVGDADAPVAVIGLGCRFPGADGPRAFWQLLCAGIDATGAVPADRWDADALFDPDPGAPGKAITRRGAFLDGIDRFDPRAFGIAPREAARMDPQQRLLLEVVWESLQDAGVLPASLAGSATAVYVGIANSDFGRYLFQDPTAIDAYFGTGSAFSIAANRISYLLDLRGPSVAIDSACSSSLVAVHAALQAVRSGEAELAIAGGVNVVLRPEVTINFSKAGVMAPDGRCKTFDARADGYARGEGAGAVVLKPLARALADGDPIYAVLRGSAVNSDGRSNGLMAPSGEAQRAVIREACRRAGVTPGEVQFVETHGTGTHLGDPIEVGALGDVLADGRPPEAAPCALGAVKSNIGHLEAAAGIAGLIKTVLAIHHGRIPASLHLEQPNPHIPFERLPVRVPTRLETWPGAADQRVAGVSSFGFGGTNAHVVLAAAPAEASAANGHRDDRGPWPLLLSARSADGLRQLARDCADAVEGASLSAVVGTAALRRQHHRHRLAAVAGSIDELRGVIGAFLDGEAPAGLSCGEAGEPAERRLAFLFPGQGPQWFGMGRELMEREPVFREVMQRCARLVEAEAGWSLLDALAASERDSRIHETEVTQPALFALQVALAALWRSWGVEPDAIVGHSMGEVAAAHVAGALDLERAVRVIVHRGRLMQRVVGRGAMAAVEMPLADARELLAGRERQLSVAANNGPRSCVIAGEPAALQQVLDRLLERGVFWRRLRVDLAGHSPHMDTLEAELVDAVGPLAAAAPAVPLVSTVTGREVDAAGALDGPYWARNLRDPVLFHGALQRALQRGIRVFVELGPHPVLIAAVQQVMDASAHDGVALASLRREGGERRTLLSTAGALYTLGVPVELARLVPEPSRAVALPPVPWERERCWVDIDAPTRALAARPEDGVHPLLGRHTDSPALPGTHLWEHDLALSRLPFLADHRVHDAVVFPATGYLEMVRAAATASRVDGESAGGHGGDRELFDVRFERALCLPDDGSRRVQVAIEPDDDPAADPGASRSASPSASPSTSRFAVYSRPDDARGTSWTRHVVGRIRAISAAAVGDTPDAVRARCPRPLDAAAHYRSYRERGIGYGPAFQGVSDGRRGDGEAIARVRMPTGAAGPWQGFALHPALLDACLQVMAAVLPDDDEDARRTYLPVGVERIALLAPPAGEVWSHVRYRSGDEHGHVADVRVIDDDGRTAVAVDGLRVRRLEADAFRPAGPREWVHQLEWRASARDAVSAAALADPSRGAWVVFVDDLGVGEPLLARLEAAGQHVVTVRRGDDFRVLGRDAYQVAPGRADSFDALVQALVRRSGLPLARVVYLWALDAPDSVDVTPDGVDDAQQQGCVGALHLAQSIAKHASQRPPLLWLVTRGAQPVATEPDVAGVMQAPLWGLGRVLAQEFPAIWGGLIDLDPRSDVDADTLFEAIAAPDDEDQLALRQGCRWVPRLVAREDVGTAPALRCRPDGCYLITGGLGALGRRLAGWLVERGARHLALLGRRPFPQHASWREAAAAGDDVGRELVELERRGATVHVIAADVADEAAVGEALARLGRRAPPLRGVIHAAGVVSPTAAADLDEAALRAVLRPKVRGAWVLHRCTRELPLEMFVGFASAAGVWGSRGLAHYAAANHFLDALAHHRAAAGLPALAVDWAMWDGGGMSSSGAARDQLTGTGLRPMAPTPALWTLEQLLGDGTLQATVADVDWAVFKPLYEAQGRRRLLELVRGGTAAAPASRSRDDGLVDHAARRRVLAIVDADERLAEVARIVARQAAHVLGLPVTDVDPSAPLSAHGLDSLTASELRTRLEGQLGVRIDVLTLLRGESALGVASGVLPQLADAGGRGAVDAGAPAPATDDDGAAEDPIDPDVQRWEERDVSLEADIVAPGPLSVDAFPPRAVLLTGATGYLGAFVLAELCRRSDAHVYCHVRAADELDAARRLRHTLRDYRLWDDDLQGRIHPVVGDLSQPGLGIERPRYTALAGRVDQVVHVGYLVNFLFGYPDLRPTNVLGTKEILRFATRTRLKPVHFVSSFSVFLTPEYRGRPVGEHDPLYPGAGAYRETKRVCEAMLTNARQRGLPVSIYRPPFVSWHTDSGVANERDFLIRLIRGCHQLGAAPDLDLCFHLAPVDFVARALVQLVGDPRALGGDYNVLADAEGTRWPALVQLLGEAGAELPLVPYDEWRERLRAAGSDNPLHVFFPALGPDVPEQGSAVIEMFHAHGMPSRVDATEMLARLGRIPPEARVDAARTEAFVQWLQTGQDEGDDGGVVFGASAEVATLRPEGAGRGEDRRSRDAFASLMRTTLP